MIKKSNGYIDSALYKELFGIDVSDEEIKAAMAAAKEDIKNEYNRENKLSKTGKSNKGTTDSGKKTD